MEQLTLTLKPRWGRDTVADMVIAASFPADGFPSDLSAPAIEYPDEAFGGIIPFPDYRDFSIRDDAGAIPYVQKDAPPLYTSASFRGLYFQRKPQGMVHWSMRLLPRVLPEGYSSSPYYDFRAEPNGLNGSGMFSFMLPATSQKQIRVHLEWDLSEMPAGTRGIWSYGEGSVDKVLTQWQIMLTLFDTGLMHAVEKDGFGVYWLSEPDCDVKSVAEKLLPIFRYESSYFHDENAMFRVFLRRDPFPQSGGGSACPYAFISGFSAFGGMDADRWFNVLIHEMTHTWPSMTDFNVGEGTWFSEGATEYYCTMLPYKGGYLDADFTVKCINDKITDRYYTNPYREMPNMEIPKIQWKDRRAQTVPYGRGFLYLANVEAKLRRRSLGSIDEIVKQHSITDPMTSDDWEKFVRQKLGEEGIREFEDMKAGKLLIPEENLFGDAFITVKDTIELEGKKVFGYHWEVRK